MTAAEQRAEDKERLQDVTHVLHGEHGTGAVQRVLYAVYLLGLLAFTYGFTVARALFITSDPAWLHDRLLGPGAAVVAVLLAVALTVLVHGLGRRRGPVVPPLPWVDHVVAGPLDRAATLREWWLVSATLLVAGATVFAGRPRRGAVGVGHDRARCARRRAARRPGARGGRRRGLARRPGRCRLGRPRRLPASGLGRRRAPRAARPVRRAAPPRASRAARPEHPLHPAGRRGARW